MPSLDTKALTHRLKGRQLTQAVVNGTHKLALHFQDGSVLSVESAPDGLLILVENAGVSEGRGTAEQPTKRQLEYLVFIARYIGRFGRAPAESDIERHFLVSAPSVNQMMQTLERRGFIARQPGVARSIRLCIDLDAQSTSP
jgi:hypothetical protein